MAYEYRYRRRINFAETDLAGIAHFSNYYRYMEEAEHDFLRSLGFSVHHRAEGEREVGFPRVASRCEYRRPVRFEDELEIHVWVSLKNMKMIEYSFRLECEGEEVAIGRMLTIACAVDGEGGIESVPLPAGIDAALEVAPYPRLEFRSDRAGGDS